MTVWVCECILSPSLPPPTSLPYALVMRCRLIDWGWRYDYLSSPPPSLHPLSLLYILLLSPPHPGHSSEEDKACLLHVYWFVLIVWKQGDSLCIRDGGRGTEIPPGACWCLCRPARSPAWMIHFGFLSGWILTQRIKPQKSWRKHTVNGFCCEVAHVYQFLLSSSWTLDLCYQSLSSCFLSSLCRKPIKAENA